MGKPVIHPPGVSSAQFEAMLQSLSPSEFEFYPADGSTHMVPDTDALLINVLLWPDAALDDLQLILPPIKAGRRVFIYTDKAVAQLTLTSPEVGVTVANNSVSLSANDLIVFNTVSTTNKLWARVATS